MYDLSMISNLLDMSQRHEVNMPKLHLFLDLSYLYGPSLDMSERAIRISRVASREKRSKIKCNSST